MLVAVLAAATAFGLWRLRTDGRVRDTSDTPADLVRADEIGRPLGERATLLQFSSAFCAPCKATRHVLEQVASAVPGVAHVEVDAENHLELVRRLDVRRTPTTLVLDAHGHEVRRASGVPKTDDVLSVLTEAVA